MHHYRVTQQTTEQVIHPYQSARQGVPEKDMTSSY